ncbi:hypothetical protein P2318_06905 [Myxococcaceae bacterium GXIMD 01537]
MNATEVKGSQGTGGQANTTDPVSDAADEARRAAEAAAEAARKAAEAAAEAARERNAQRARELAAQAQALAAEAGKAAEKARGAEAQLAGMMERFKGRGGPDSQLSQVLEKVKGAVANAQASAGAAVRSATTATRTSSQVAVDRFEMVQGAVQERAADGFVAQTTSTATRQALGASSTGIPSPAEQRKLADENYKNMVEAFEKAPGSTRDFAINMLAVHAQEPDYQAQFIKRLYADGLLQQLTGSPVAGATGTLAKALDSARSRGVITNDQLRTFGERPEKDKFFFWNEQGWRDIGLKMSPPVRGIAPAPGSNRALGEVEAARGELLDAQGKVLALEQQLAEELNQFGPGLTNEQREGYVRQFQALHKGDFDAESAAAKKLNDKLQAAPLKDVLVENPESAETLREAYEALATTEHATNAINWVRNVFSETEPGLRKRLEAGFEMPLARLGTELGKSLVEPAIERAAGKILFDAQGDVAKAEQQLYTLGEQLKAVKELRIGGGDFLTAVKEPLNQIKQGNLDGLKTLVNKWEQSSGATKKFVGAFYAFGVMLAAQKGKDGDYASMVKELASSSKGFAELSADAMTTFTQAGKYAKFSNGAKSAATFIAEKLAPGLGILASGASLYAHGSQFLKDRNNPFLVTAMIGDAWSMFGEALSMFPPTYVPGKIISAMGAIVSGASDMVTTALTLGKTRDEQRTLLRQAGVPADIIEGLVFGDVNALSDRGSLNANQVQTFLREHGGLSRDPSRLDALLSATEKFRMYNTNFMQFIERMATEGNRSVEEIANTLQSIISQDSGDQNLRAFIQNAYPETAAWADARAPRDR